MKRSGPRPPAAPRQRLNSHHPATTTMQALRKALGHLFHGRFGDLADALTDRIPRKLYRRGTMLLFELSADGIEACADHTAELPVGCTFRPASNDELHRLEPSDDRTSEEYRRRLATGDVCHALFDGDRPVNVNWVHLGPCYVRGAGFLLDAAPTDAYIYGVVTDPAQRGRGIYRATQRELVRVLGDSGSQRLIQMVEDGNSPVLTTLPKIGYRHTRTIRYTRLFGTRRVVVTDHETRTIVRRFYWSTPDRVSRI